MNHEEANINLNSICFGLFIILNFITGAIADFVKVPNLFPIMGFLIGVVSCAKNYVAHKRLSRIKILYFLLAVIFLVDFVFSYLTIKADITLHYLLCFLTLGVSGLVVANVPFNIIKVRHTVVLLAFINIYHFLNMLGSEYSVYTSGEQMGNAYSVLMILFFALWTIFDEEGFGWWKVFSIADILLCFALLIRVMTRGAWLCIAIFLVFLFIKFFRGKKALFAVLLLVPSLMIALPYLVEHYLKGSQWYYFMFTGKAYDVLNGRSDLFTRAFKYRGILQTIFGSGIGSYYEMYRTYPHNLIAQLYHDQGLVGLFFIIHILIKGLKGIFNDYLHNDEEAFLIISLCCASLIRLMLSYYFWIDQLFWLLLGLLIQRYYDGKNNTIGGKNE